jgi:hypothetical protein
MALTTQLASAGLPISADSHVVEAPEVFAGLAQRFGDEAPRITSVDGQVDAMAIPARGVRAVPAGELGIAGRRLDPGRRIERRPGHKPSPEDKGDPYIQDIVRRGYAGLREVARAQPIRIRTESAPRSCIRAFSFLSSALTTSTWWSPASAITTTGWPIIAVPPASGWSGLR